MKMSLLVVAVAGCTASLAHGQSISTGFTGATVINPTAPALDDYNGNFFDITALSGDITINSWEIHSNQAAGVPLTVQIWYKAGAWSGFQNNQAAWTLAGQVSATAGGPGLPTPVTVTPFMVPLGQTYGIRIGANPGKLRYHSLAQTITPFSNNDVRLDFGAAQATIWTGGLAAQPRGWNGTINYSVTGAVSGACCKPDGTCEVLLPAACSTQNGAYQGPGSTCFGQCPQPGACCMPDGSCTFSLQTACTNGGVWSGAGVTCAAANCPPPGACCLPNGGCVSLQSIECGTAGGTFGGAGTLCAQANCWTAPILYHNGGIVTLPGAGFGGADASQIAPGANTIGENWNLNAIVRVADDFTIPQGESWTITKFWTYGYQTLAPTSPVPYLSMVLRIWDRDPRLAGATVLFGDITTNVLDTTESQFSNIYRVAGDPQNADRAVFKLVADVPNVQLGAGNYWLEYGATNGATPFMPLVTTLNNIPRGNALIWRNAPWAPVVDIGFNIANYPAGQPAGLPFVIEGSIGGGCYANCDGSTEPPILNVADFGCFLGKYAAGDPYANCDNSTDPPVLNVADFGCFLGKYAAGCQ